MALRAHVVSLSQRDLPILPVLPRKVYDPLYAFPKQSATIHPVGAI